MRRGVLFVFVCKQKTAYEMRISDWSSDVCSSDLTNFEAQALTDFHARHIAIILHDFSTGGSERIAIRLANRWVQMGRRVSLYCGTEQGQARALVGPGVAVRCCSPSPFAVPCRAYRSGGGWLGWCGRMRRTFSFPLAIFDRQRDMYGQRVSFRLKLVDGRII